MAPETMLREPSSSAPRQIGHPGRMRMMDAWRDRVKPFDGRLTAHTPAIETHRHYRRVAENARRSEPSLLGRDPFV
jgi:hypothetical protein